MAKGTQADAPARAPWLRQGSTGVATSLNLLGLGVPSLLALFTIPVLLRVLGDGEFGLFALAWAAMGYFSILDLGITRATSRSVAIAKDAGRLDQAGKALRLALAIQFALGCLVAVVLIKSSATIVSLLRVRHESVGVARDAMWWLAIGLPFTLVTGAVNGAFEGLRLFGLLNITRFASSLLLLGLPVIAVLAGAGLTGAVGALAIARMLGFAMVAMAIGRHLKSVPSQGPSITVGSLYRYGTWVTVTGITAPLLSQSDRFIVGGVLGMPEVAAYAAPTDVISRLSIVPAALTSALFPKIAALDAAGGRSAVREEVLRWAMRLGVGMAGFIALLLPSTPWLLTVWLGPAIAAKASVATQILLIGTLINTVAWLPSTFFVASGRPHIPAISQLIQLPLYFAAASLLTARLGLMGVAIASLGRAIVDTSVLYVLFFWITRSDQPSIHPQS
jgi:O-antigen/teichoic acid export membrane protein